MFINDFKISFIENSRLSEDLIDKIIRIKQNYWEYSYEAHKKWMKENIKDGEHHLILKGYNDEIVAYLNIVKTKIVYDNIEEEVMGIGNVCVERSVSRQGIGQLFMCVCNYYLDAYNKKAMLFCREHLVKFYANSGWVKYEGEVYIKNIRYEGKTMFNSQFDASKIKMERDF